MRPGSFQEILTQASHYYRDAMGVHDTISAFTARRQRGLPAAYDGGGAVAGRARRCSPASPSGTAIVAAYRKRAEMADVRRVVIAADTPIARGQCLCGFYFRRELITPLFRPCLAMRSARMPLFA